MASTGNRYDQILPAGSIHSPLSSQSSPNASPNSQHTRRNGMSQHSHSNSNACLQPTWHGFIHSTHDALMVLEACLQGQLSHIPRRPHDRERISIIASGNTFIYEENASGIKRWTDGVTWSPSRIMGNFLVYRELNEPFPAGEKKKAKKRKRGPEEGAPGDGDQPAQTEEDRKLVGSLVDSYGFKTGGLIKKTLNVKYNHVNHHIVSYYSLDDVKAGTYQRPSFSGALKGLSVRPELLSISFKAPIKGEDDLDVDPFRDPPAPIPFQNMSPYVSQRPDSPHSSLPVSHGFPLVPQSSVTASWTNSMSSHSLAVQHPGYTFQHMAPPYSSQAPNPFISGVSTSRPTSQYFHGTSAPHNSSHFARASTSQALLPHPTSSYTPPYNPNEDFPEVFQDHDHTAAAHDGSRNNSVVVPLGQPMAYHGFAMNNAGFAGTVATPIAGPTPQPMILQPGTANATHVDAAHTYMPAYHTEDLKLSPHSSEQPRGKRQHTMQTWHGHFDEPETGVDFGSFQTPVGYTYSLTS